jgi:CO/xanthine dehydrogenase Mo-binding subunit
MAEMPYLPLAPAVVAAVRDAVGVWFEEFPLTPERVWRGMWGAGGLPAAGSRLPAKD